MLKAVSNHVVEILCQKKYKYYKTIDMQFTSPFPPDIQVGTSMAPQCIHIMFKARDTPAHTHILSVTTLVQTNNTHFPAETVCFHAAGGGFGVVLCWLKHVFGGGPSR